MDQEQLIAHLKSENERMRDLLDRRPALNSGLVEAYAEWTRLCYLSDLAFGQESEAH